MSGFRFSFNFIMKQKDTMQHIYKQRQPLIYSDSCGPATTAPRIDVAAILSIRSLRVFMMTFLLCTIIFWSCIFFLLLWNIATPVQGGSNLWTGAMPYSIHSKTFPLI